MAGKNSAPSSFSQLPVPHPRQQGANTKTRWPKGSWIFQSAGPWMKQDQGGGTCSALIQDFLGVGKAETPWEGESECTGLGSAQAPQGGPGPAQAPKGATFPALPAHRAQMDKTSSKGKVSWRISSLGVSRLQSRVLFQQEPHSTGLVPCLSLGTC